MSLTEQSAALRARNLVTEKGEGFIGISIPKIISQIPTALGVWANAAIKDPSIKSLFEQSVDISIVNGIADLTTYFNGDVSSFDQSNFGACTNARLAETDSPITWVNSLNQLKYPRALSGGFITLYLDGNILRSRNTDGDLTSLNDTLTVNAIVLPTTVDEIPEDLNLEGSFCMALAKLAVQEFPPPKVKAK